MTNNRDLAVPAEVETDAKAVEILRAWVANQGLACALRPATWKDAGHWGIVLADVARHVANAMRDEFGDEPSSTVARIVEMFNRELKAPTDDPTGSLVG
jgi:hypothetical protein